MDHQGCPIYGKIRFKRIFITCFSQRTKTYLRTNLRICSYSGRLLPSPPPTPFPFRCPFETRGVSHAPSEHFGYYPLLRPHCTFETRGILRQLFFRLPPLPPGYGRLPKSQDFSEFRLGNHGPRARNRAGELDICFAEKMNESQ